MKRLLFLAALFLCSHFTFAQLLGSGTEDDPYMIYDTDDLNDVRDYVGVSGIYFKLANDIDLSAYSEDEGWEPIGTQGTHFKGNFNGNGHIIKNLKIKRPETDYVGLFGYCDGSLIKNLRIICDITGNSHIGGVSGCSIGGQFDNCQIEGTIIGKSSDIGGITGYTSSIIINCVSLATVKGNGDVGGLIGRYGASGGTVVGCNVSGIIVGSGSNCGGIIGRIQETTNITNCLFDGSIDGSSFVGGIIGYVSKSSTCSECNVNSTKIKGTSNVGGLCGYSYMNVNKCNVTASIEGNEKVGGLCGESSSSTIQFCTTNVSINAGSYVGGIAGISGSSTIDQCKADCIINSTGNYAGGVTGYNSSAYIANCYFSGTIISNNDNVGGIAGYNNNASLSIYNCISNATIEGPYKVGGICGYTYYGYIQNCLALNPEIKSSGADIGRIIGACRNNNGIKSNLALSTTKVYNGNSLITVTDGFVNGTSYGSAILKMKSTYTDLGWDFDEVWDIDEGTSYPYLRYFNPTETQNIVFETPSLTYGDGEYTLPETTEQGLTIKWTCSNENKLSVTGNKATVKGTGECYLIAEQAGNNVYKSIRKSYPITIAKAPLTITADNFTRNIGEANPELTVTYSGFVYNEDETALTTPPAITTEATINSPAGVYAITVSGAQSDNYDISYMNGTLTIIDEATLRNTLAVTQTLLRTGNNANLSISLDNEDTMIAFEFYMQLPEGISIALDEDGYPDVILNSARSNRHVLEVSQNSAGLYHFLCYSNSNNALKGNSGELLSINIVCDEDVNPEIYQGHIRNIKFSDNNENRIILPNLDFDLEVSNVLMGDVNDDGDIDVMDVVMMVNYMMERPSASFIFAAADHTGDGIVDVMDLVREVSLVMSQQASGAPVSQSYDAFGGGLSLIANNDGLVNVHLADGKQYVASQFIVALSEGQVLTDVTSDKSHHVSIQPLPDNRYFVMSYSMSNETFAVSDQTVTLHVVGQGTVSVEDIAFVDTNENKVAFQNASTETTGITKTTMDFSTPADIYSVDGALIKKDVITKENIPNGLYIINGKKIVVK